MSTIEVAIAGRGIQVKQGYEKPSAGDVNTCSVSLAIESGGVWDSLPHKRVTFATRTASVTVDYAPVITIPHEVMASPGALYITLTGYDADGIEVARTHRMTYPIEVAKAGADEGAEPSPATLDVVSRIDALAADLEEKRDTDYWRGEPGSPGEPGKDGAPGAPGYSPTASVTKVGGTATITVTDKNGTTTATVSDGAPGKDGSDATATDVRIAGKSITADGVANIPIASNTNIGLVKLWEYGGLVYGEAGLETVPASEATISARNGSHYCIPADSRLDYAVKAAMCDGKGAAWTAAEQVAAKKRMGIDTVLVENVLVGSETGSVAHVEDALAGASMREITVEGACKQDGIPSPDAPKPIAVVENPTVKVTGRNLLDASLLIVGHSVDSKDGHIYKTSTNSWYANVDFIDVRPIAGKQVAASGLLAGKRTNFLFYDSNEGYISYTGDSKETFVFNVPDNAELMRVDMHADVYGQGTASLELAQASGSYKPYTSQSLTFTLPAEHPYLAKLDNKADEIVVDQDGNVELVARVGIDTDVRTINDFMQGQYYSFNVHLRPFASSKDDYTGTVLCSALPFKNSTLNGEGIYRTWNGIYVKDTSGRTKEEIQAEIDKNAPLTVVARIPETRYALGKIELPKAQDSIVNVWTDAEVTPRTGIEYVRDVNIVVANIESAIASITQG